MRSLYDPSTYPQGVANPYGARVHAWNEDGPAEYGTRYHGGVWTQPMPADPWQPRPIAGLGCLGCADVDTRGGVFGSPRYGGGVFSGLGAAGGLWWCWDEPGFKECHAEQMVGAQAACKGLSFTAFGYPDYDTCVNDLTEKITAQRCTCAEAPPEGAANDPVDYPWMKYSAKTKALQDETNAVLASNGYNGIGSDGKLGAMTCGAIREMNAAANRAGIEGVLYQPSTCQAFTAPTLRGQAPAPLPISPVPPPGQVCPPGQVLLGGQCVAVAPTPEPEKKGGITTAWIVGGLLAAAVVGGVVYAVQQDKKKQQKRAA